MASGWSRQNEDICPIKKFMVYSTAGAVERPAMQWPLNVHEKVDIPGPIHLSTLTNGHSYYLR